MNLGEVAYPCSFRQSHLVISSSLHAFYVSYYVLLFCLKLEFLTTRWHLNICLTVLL